MHKQRNPSQNNHKTIIVQNKQILLEIDKTIQTTKHIIKQIIHKQENEHRQNIQTHA